MPDPMDELRADKMQSSQSFQSIGLHLHDAAVNKNRIKYMKAKAERQAARKLKRLRKKEAKRQRRAEIRSEPPTFFRKVKRFILTIIILAFAGLAWLYALGVYVSSTS